MYNIIASKQFKKDYKKCIKRSLDINLIDKVVLILEKEGKLPIIYNPHKLSGNYNNYWECHIKPDWLLIWQIIDYDIFLVRTGKHSDLL